VSGSGDSELEEVWARARGAMAAIIQSATVLAEAMIEVRIAALRRAAAQEREQAQQLRELARLQRQADAAVWRAAMRPQWWREAGAEDIGRVWRAASTWHHVDERAAAARQVVVDRLADRGVDIDPTERTTPSPDDVAWLSDALDRAAAAPSEPEAGAGRTPRASDGEVIEGEFRESTPQSGQAKRRTAEQDRADREARSAERVRAVWPAERAERVISCRAWGALAHQLGQLEEAGHDVEALLRGVPDFVDRAHTPAAFAFRSIDDRLDGLVDLGTQPNSGEARQETGARSAASESPFGESAPAPVEIEGKRLAGEATAEQVQASGIAYWSQRHAEAMEATADPSRARDARGHTVEDRKVFTRNKMRNYQPGSGMTPYWFLGREDPADQRGILAQLQALRGTPAESAAEHGHAQTGLGGRARRLIEEVDANRSMAAAPAAENSTSGAADERVDASRPPEQPAAQHNGGISDTAEHVRAVQTRAAAAADDTAQAAAGQAAAGQAAAGAERAAAHGHRAVERDERAAQAHAEPLTDGQAEVDRAQGQADLHADLAAAHEVRAAQLVAQGFPDSTSEAVAAATERAASRTAAASREQVAVQPATKQRREPTQSNAASTR